jgi:hypothetical protein
MDAPVIAAAVHLWHLSLSSTPTRNLTSAGLAASPGTPPLAFKADPCTRQSMRTAVFKACIDSGDPQRSPRDVRRERAAIRVGSAQWTPWIRSDGCGRVRSEPPDRPRVLSEGTSREITHVAEPAASHLPKPPGERRDDHMCETSDLLSLGLSPLMLRNAVARRIDGSTDQSPLGSSIAHSCERIELCHVRA